MGVHQFPAVYKGPPASGDRSDGMEVRIARLESDVSFMRSDISDIKSDIKELRRDFSGMRSEIHAAKLWAIGLYAALVVGLFYFLSRIVTSLPG